MKTLEIAGPIGAGKSSLVEPLARALRDRGVMARPMDAVVPDRRALHLLWSIAFAVRNPSLLARAAGAALQAPIPWWHRRIILGLALGVGGRTMAAGRRAATNEWVIVDEGLVHRAVNLYAWRSVVPQSEVRHYLATVPEGNAVVIVQASPEVELERALRRGLPKRLVGRTPEEVRAFVTRAREIVLLSAEVMEGRGVRVLRVDSNSPAASAAAAVAEALVQRRAPRPPGSNS